MPWLFEHDYLAPFKRLFSQPRRTHYRLTLLLSLPICQLQETQRALRPLGWIKTPSSNHLHFTLRLPHHFESCRGKRHQRRAATLILSEHIYSFDSKRRITLRKYILCTRNSLTTPWSFLPVLPKTNSTAWFGFPSQVLRVHKRCDDNDSASLAFFPIGSTTGDALS